MLCRADVAVRVGDRSHLGKADDQLARAGSQVDRVNARLARRRDIVPGIPESHVAVTGPHIFQAAKVDRKRAYAVGAEREDRVRQRTPLTRHNVQDVADKTAVRPVIPDDLTIRSRQPLQHAARLPAPKHGSRPDRSSGRRRTGRPSRRGTDPPASAVDAQSQPPCPARSERTDQTGACRSSRTSGAWVQR